MHWLRDWLHDTTGKLKTFISTGKVRFYLFSDIRFTCSFLYSAITCSPCSFYLASYTHLTLSVLYTCYLFSNTHFTRSIIYILPACLYTFYLLAYTHFTCCLMYILPIFLYKFTCSLTCISPTLSYIFLSCRDRVFKSLSQQPSTLISKASVISPSTDIHYFSQCCVVTLLCRPNEMANENYVVCDSELFSFVYLFIMSVLCVLSVIRE